MELARHKMTDPSQTAADPAVADHPWFPGVTIDASFSRDLDDAIWVEQVGDGWRVTVCVADVSATVAMGSPEDKAALETGFTRYAATRSIRTMLPTILSEDRLSLVPGEARDVLGVILLLNKDLAVADIRIAFGSLLHRGRLSHEQASALIDSGGADLHRMMAHAWELASSLLHRRQGNGAMAFFSSLSGLATTEEGNLIDTGIVGPVSRAYIIVQELMILTNRALAEYFVSRDVHLLYRNHRASLLASREALHDDMQIVTRAPGPTSNAARTRLGMLLGRATLDPIATGHFGLNVPVYAWFTSPIRRYADLVNQRIIKAVLLGQPLPYTPGDLEHVALHLNDAYKLEAETRSNAFKEASERRAGRAVAIENFAGLDQAGFHAVIKTAFSVETAMETVPASLKQEVLSRLSKGRLADKDALRVLLARGPASNALKLDLLRGLEENGPMVQTTLNHMVQAHELSALEWDETAGDGPAHAPEFHCRGRAFLRNEHYIGVLVRAGRRVEARQRAGLSLLSKLAEVDWQAPLGWMVGAKIGNVTQGSVAGNDDNLKGRLQELCQKRRWPAPVYAVKQSGAPHAPAFAGTVCIAMPTGVVQRSSKVSGGSRKEAERNAAADLLAKLLVGADP